MTFRGELTSFDVKSGKSSLYMGGISADCLEVSRDGKQAVYVSYPQGDLWRSNLDGTERVQLTFAPFKPVLPRWSPDGQTILFFQFPGGAGHPGKMFEIPSAGGAPHEVLPNDTENEQDPTWSADGRRIVFAGDANDAHRATGPSIKIVDVQTGEVSPVTGSEKMFSP